MSDLTKTLVGNWNVAFNQYRWIYTFFEGGAISWRDAYNGKNGTGTWVNSSDGILISWKNSKTKETWNKPIEPADQTGNIVADWATGSLSATKDQSGFNGFAPEGQMDAFACWAACLSWYTKVQADVPTVAQQSIIAQSNPQSWAANGSISANGLMTLSLSGVMMSRSRIAQGALDGRIRARRFPMLIGFSAGPMGGHVNVLHSLDEKAGTVGVMEPWFPDPSVDKAYDFDGEVFSNKKTGTAFKFKGQNTRRPISYYTSRPMNGEFIVGHNAKYG